MFNVEGGGGTRSACSIIKFDYATLLGKKKIFFLLFCDYNDIPTLEVHTSHSWPAHCDWWRCSANMSTIRWLPLPCFLDNDCFRCNSKPKWVDIQLNGFISVLVQITRPNWSWLWSMILVWSTHLVASTLPPTTSSWCEPQSTVMSSTISLATCPFEISTTASGSRKQP